MSFTHLHVHSHYSLLDGLPKIDELISTVAAQSMTAVALTDHGTMSGLIEFYQKATKAGIKPILGVETYVARRTHKDKESGIDEKPYHLVLLAETTEGYKNLLKLITRAHLEGFYYKPRIDWDLLKEYHQGLIASSACLAGEIAQSILTKNPAHTDELIQKFISVFGKNNFFLEVQPLDSDEQRKVNEAVFRLAEKHEVKVIATNDVHYLRTEDAEAQDILLCIQTKRVQTDTDRMSYIGQDLSLKSEEVMLQAFSDHPEVIENTVSIANRCNVELSFGTPLLPHFPLPENVTAEDHLEALCRSQLPVRYPKTHTDATIVERLNYELKTIRQTGFASYMLIVHDFVSWAKSHSIVVGPGRGSAAGSIVSYLLNITNVDPIKYELLFERFLNPERISMPDIDLDFADTRRDEVIRYVEEKYGKDHVAQIITFGTMAARAAIRDVGRVMALPYSYCDRIAKLIPMFTTLHDAIATVPELKEVMTDPEGRKLLTMAQKLEGVARHASTHACGVIITKDQLDHYVPTQYASASDNTVISQYSLHPIEDLGILKMDFLGLRNLTVIEQTLEIISKAEGVSINIDAIPLDDAATFETLQKGQTVGVFQLESSGMRRYLKELKPSSLEDIIAMVSLYRPGPIEFIPDFISGKHGKKQLSYLHPKLEPILKKTYGIVVYQEQVLEIARELAGFTYGQADVLRKAVGKKIKSLLDEQREKLIQGMMENGITEKTANLIWEFVEPFARYGFNRAHAACYAIIAYQTAYLKTHYPESFMAALMTGDQHDIDRISIEVEEAKHMGITVLAPDINESYSTFTAVYNPETKKPTKKIRFGLLAIKNVGENLVRMIVHERKEKGPYPSLENFLERIQTKDLNKKSLESLIQSGALDEYAERNQLLSNCELLLKFSKNFHEELETKQSSLFSSLKKTQGAPALRLKNALPATKKQRLQWEKHLLGLYITEHPTTQLLKHYGNKITPIGTLLQQHHLPPKTPFRLIGVIVAMKRILTKAMDPMLFVKLEDATGSIEIIVFPKLYATTSGVWQEGATITVTGKLSQKDGEDKLIVDQVKELTGSTEELIIEIPSSITQESFASLQRLLEGKSGPLPVLLKITHGNEKKTVSTKFSINLTPELYEAIIATVGNASVRFVG